ncbi:O-antigen ligase family protein [Bacillus sp. KH172YL63]|uniref:O-antigen ligase family protein n=1 Tax=Bacillus sp. KH172YL63 TaxID=2709784 RepID=UPI0013E46E04|nr:O-antigen ligase family protein [Bacillus sp. KH172YL63]BCB05664.1 membrane protein [Bacillus sp. KH172YL63]
MKPTNSPPGWLLPFLFITIAVSSIVLVEPSPYDLLMMVLIFLTLKKLIPFSLAFPAPMLLLVAFILCNLFSLFFAKDPVHGLNYSVITFYLVVTWVCIGSVSYLYSEKAIETIFNGYVIAAIAAALIGIGSFFNLFPFSDVFMWSGRIKSLFKDPNVFGPFLIPAALFLLLKIESGAGRRKALMFFGFIVLVLAVSLSFSRAAWGHLVIALFVYFHFFRGNLNKRIGVLILLLVSFIPILFFVTASSDLMELFQERFGYQEYDNTRFDKQRESLEAAITYPWGVGSGQSEMLFNHSTHSLYVRILTENGVIGIISFLAFVGLSISQCFKQISCLQGMKQGLFVVILASIIGLLFNSFFIDTLHWRHFWLLLALPWCMTDKPDHGRKEREGTI